MKSVNKVLTLILISFTFLCQAQNKVQINPLNDEIYNLYVHLTSGLKIDSTARLQSGWIFIKVNKSGKVREFKVNGLFDEKFVNVLKSNVYNPKAPWLNINKQKYLWYVLPMTFGQIPSNSTPKDVQSGILTLDYNLMVLREIMISDPGHIILLNALKELTNFGMRELRI